MNDYDDLFQANRVVIQFSPALGRRRLFGNIYMKSVTLGHKSPLAASEYKDMYYYPHLYYQRLIDGHCQMGTKEEPKQHTVQTTVS